MFFVVALLLKNYNSGHTLPDFLEGKSNVYLVETIESLWFKHVYWMQAYNVKCFTLTLHVYVQARRHWGAGGAMPPNNLPNLFLEML